MAHLVSFTTQVYKLRSREALLGTWLRKPNLVRPKTPALSNCIKISKRKKNINSHLDILETRKMEKSENKNNPLLTLLNHINSFYFTLSYKT